MNYLRPESLAQDPLERLAEASTNLWWAVADVQALTTQLEVIEHHFDVTPVHEAGHAVAATLVGRNVKHVMMWHPFARWPTAEACGLVECDDWEPNCGAIAMDEIAHRFGPEALVLDMVQTYAGPAAEIRHNPSCVASGKSGDFEHAERCASWLEMERGLDRFALQNWAWAEACSMMADPNVWAAVTAIANRLKGSQSLPPKTSGGFVRSCVRKHVPAGRAWSRNWQALQRSSSPA